MLLGLIQNEAVVGDLSHNLRLIVQGYRRCLDAGAELVIASAQALDGAFLHDLAARDSFRLQAQAALAALAGETSCPLLLASYAGAPHEEVQAQPYLLSRGKVRRLPNRRAVSICGLRVLVDVGEQPVFAEKSGVDVRLHLPTAPWWLGQQEAYRAGAARESQQSGAHVLLLRGVGYTEGELSPGGSLASSPRGASVQLPLFSACSRVWSTRSAAAAAPPATGEQLLSATSYGLRACMQQGGYEGVAIDVSAPRAALLLGLARLAVGARSTVALCGDRHELCALAGKRCALTPAQAEERGLLLLSPLCLNERLLGERTSSLPPLGEVYESELALLQASLCEQLPTALSKLLPPCPPPPESELALRLLAEQNASLAEILTRYPGVDEARLRRQLRLWSAAGSLRGDLPAVPRIRRRLVHLPVGHRLHE